MKKDSFRFEFNGGEVPKVFVNDKEVGVSAFTYQYVTKTYDSPGINLVTATVMNSNSGEQRVICYDLVNGYTYLHQ